MKQQWYKSNVAKGILIVTQHILLVVMITSFLWMMSYPALRGELFVGKPAKKYEDTVSFGNQLNNISHDVVNGVELRKKFETDGIYDPLRVVDIENYYLNSKISDEDASGLAYSLQDLYNWGEELYDKGEISYDSGLEMAYTSEETPGDDNIIVCKRSNDTYHYYYYSEFKDLIDSDMLRFVISNESEGMSGEDILDELHNGSRNEGENRGQQFKGLQDAEGRIEYIDCWSYDGTWMEEKYPPLGEKSIIDIVNNNPKWNGRLNEAFDMLHSTINAVFVEVSAYNELEELYQEGDTNLAYMYVDEDTGQVYTNRKEYEDYSKVEENLKKIRGMGKYTIVRPKLADFESNLKDTDATQWRDAIKYSVGGKNFVYAVGVDTSYPIQDDFHAENIMYEKYGSNARSIAILGVFAAILFIIFMVWLTSIAGRNMKDEELHLNWFDHIKTELAAVIIGLLWGIPLMLAYSGIPVSSFKAYDDGRTLVYQADYIYNALPYMMAGGIIAAYTCGMFLIGYLSLVRRIKARTLWSNSVLKWFFGFVGQLFRNLHAIWKVVLLFGVFAVIHWIAYISMGDGIWLFLALTVEAVAFVFLIRQTIGRQRIKKGIEKISGGEVDYKIPIYGLGNEQSDIAQRVNSIGEGLDAALEESMKSERLKTDLITNVSHDIKTPLTSIINYVELLKQENFEDPKIQRYLEVLEAKSQRLKTLTEDVVEASKVSSGNITLEYMNINLVEMIQQTSGEFEEKFKARNLKEVLTLPEQEAIIRVDGRRMWRVLENIYNNAAKYAMEGTRIYADLEVRDLSAVFNLKNVSEQQLNITADELTERFIRGDISRSTEGSGLGLSIAKTLTQMQGGKFDLYVDGDLFRVTITFPIVLAKADNEPADDGRINDGQTEA